AIDDAVGRYRRRAGNRGRSGNARRDPRHAENLRRDAVRIGRLYVLLELRSFQRHRTLQHRVVQAHTFIREEKEEVILNDRTADATRELPVLLLAPLRTLG